MAAFFQTPQFCSSEWGLNDHEQENLNNLTSFKLENFDSNGSHFSINTQQQKKGEFVSFQNGLLHKEDGNNNNIVTKYDHSTRERNRRQKINGLYSTLRSLLPPDDQSKNLSIPTTVSKVLDYIPELQQEIKTLSKKKEMLLDISNKVDQEECYLPSFGLIKNNTTISVTSTQTSAIIVSATPINDREIAIQITMPISEKRYSLSEALMSLEQEGFVGVNASCFESFDGKVFSNLHLQAEERQVILDAEMLKEKVSSLLQK